MAAAVPPRRHAGAEPGALRGVIRGPRLNPLFIFALIFTAIFILHAPLLRLPYFWDEAGYDVPAARDLLLTGSLIPHSTASHAHPPLALAWLALWWKLSGYTPAVARTAMLLVAAFALLAVFRLARKVANLRVAVAATATDGALSGILCAKFDGPRRPGCGGIITMGYSVPRGTFSRWVGRRLLLGGAGQGDGRRGAGGHRTVGVVVVGAAPARTHQPVCASAYAAAG